MKFSTKLRLCFLGMLFAINTNAAYQIEACSSVPPPIQSNINAWKEIASQGESIINNIDKLASNVNGILKVNDDLKKMSSDLSSAAKTFNTLIPVVTPVASIKNVFSTSEKILNSINTNGVKPAFNITDQISTKTGIKELQNKLDKEVKPEIQNIVNQAKKNAADLNSQLSMFNSACNTLTAVNSACIISVPQDKINQLNSSSSKIIFDLTSTQNNFVSLEKKVNSNLSDLNKVINFSDDLQKATNDIKSPVTNIAGNVSKVGQLLEKKIKIKIATYDESFTLKHAFNEVNNIVKTIKKIPGVKNVESQVNKPITEVMDEVTKPIEQALKPLEKGLKTPSFDLSSFSTKINSFNTITNDINGSINMTMKSYEDLISILNIANNNFNIKWDCNSSK